MEKKKIGSMLAGLGIGVGLGMLFAPKSGAETREDIKNVTKKAVDKVKDIDLNEIKDELVKDFENLKKELKDMDAEKAKKIAKEKGQQIVDKANELINTAKEKGAPMIEKAARDTKKKVADLLADLSDKLDED